MGGGVREGEGGGWPQGPGGCRARGGEATVQQHFPQKQGINFGETWVSTAAVCALFSSFFLFPLKIVELCRKDVQRGAKTRRGRNGQSFVLTGG